MITSDTIRRVLPEAFKTADLPMPDKTAGKVREWVALGEHERLIVTTDRLSAFDRILTEIPYKGQVLNQLTAWWFTQTRSIIQNHLVSVPDPNAMIVKNAQPFPVEVIVRGYITGVTGTALWYRYSLGERQIYGYTFPDGLCKNQLLDQAIITPTTKGGPTGHDERLTCQEVVEKGYLSESVWQKTMNAALQLFEFGQQKAREAGLILVDTKYEFGFDEQGELMLIDEIHTPDSSRFWKADSYETKFANGEEPENFDKEFIRLEYAQKGYRGDGEIPPMDVELFIRASQRYIQIYEMLTQETFIPGAYPVNPRLLNNLHSMGVLK
jgi:phosphoribosylaminoimidazole-succinocarboxamide synthase